MIVLKKGKFISGSKLYKVGELLPDTVDAKKLVKKGIAEYIADTTPKRVGKVAKKAEQENSQSIENAEAN